MLDFKTLISDEEWRSFVSSRPLYAVNGKRYEMIYGIGVGWRPLIGQLIDSCLDRGWNGHLLQIKEKFGGLRFYTGGVTSEVRELINEAEAQSYQICEECGEPGVPRGGGWVRTTCDEHSKGREPIE